MITSTLVFLINSMISFSLNISCSNKLPKSNKSLDLSLIIKATIFNFAIDFTSSILSSEFSKLLKEAFDNISFCITLLA